MKTLQTKIESLAFGGDGVGRVDGKVCFVRGALPEEEITFKVIKETSSYVKGEVLDILSRSGDRVTPPCGYYGLCGGCDLQHMTYESELLSKKSQITDLFRRIGAMKDFSCGEIMPSGTDYFYRSHVTLHKTRNGYGFYGRDKKSILKIDHCHIADREINALIGTGVFGTGKDRVTLKVDHFGKVWTSGLSGERFFLDRFGDTEMFFSPMSFSQCNRDISTKMAHTLNEWIGKGDNGTVFFDVFCGCGFFTFLCETDFGAKIGMDSNRISIDCAKSTKRKYGGDNIKFYKGDAEKEFAGIFENNKRSRNIVLLDPPRKGLSKYFLEWLKENRDITRMYFISCDPSRMARDAKVLVDENTWTLGKLAGFDMFPRTKHIEIMTEFVRK